MPLDPVSVGDPHAPIHNEERQAIKDLQAGLSTKISLPPGAATGDLLRWDGTAWMTTDTRFFEGNGSPNNQIAAPVGSRYVDKTGAQGAVEWIKRTGGDSNTGWITIAGDSGWIDVGTTGAPPFLNSWTNYGSTWSKAGYRKINGIVYLKGLVSRSTSRAFSVFALPVGYRPEADLHVGTYASAAVASDNSAINIIKATGEVKGRGTTGGNISFDGLSFVADN